MKEKSNLNFANKTKINYSKELNPEQAKVVLKGEGPCLVLSGPGSGKTRTLVYRAVYLLEKGIPPQNILLLTFTKKAAKEMLDRMEHILGVYPKALWGGTFHHIGNLILRWYADKLGYNRNFNILDEEDSRDLISMITQEMGIGGDTAKKFPRSNIIKKIFSLAVNSKKSVSVAVRENFSYLIRKEGTINIIPILEEIKQKYDKRKKQQNLMDYDDLLIKWLEVLLKFPEIQKRLSQRFRYVLVDEYQDINVIQDEIISKMAEAHKNIMAVGDDAQSIFAFRAADVRNLLNFAKRYPNAKIFRIETNYRSTPEILNLANNIIGHNQFQLKKVLKSTRKNGNLPALVALATSSQQAEFVAQRVAELRKQGASLSDITVLFRARYQSAEIEIELIKKNIPYIVRGGVRFFEQAHMKDILSFFRVLVNFRDEVAWQRLLRKQEGIGLVYSKRIFKNICGYNNVKSFFQEKNVKDLASGLSSYAARGFKNLFLVFSKIYRISLKDKDYMPEIIVCVLDNWYKNYLQSFYEDAQDRIEDIDQLANLSLKYSSIREMLSDFSLGEEFKGENFFNLNQALTLSTIHQAKGLEWKVVFIISLKDGEFPHAKSLQDSIFLEEERRLFYVAATRAKEELYLTYPLLCWKWNQDLSIKPSIFVREIDQSLLRKWEITKQDEDENIITL